MKEKLCFIIKFGFYIFVIFILNNVCSQNLDWEWIRVGGGKQFEINYSSHRDSYGNVYVTGCFFSDSIKFNSTILINSSSGSADIYVVKYDKDGNVLWARSAGGMGDDRAYSIVSDKFENLYMVGFFTSNEITFGAYTF